MEKFLLKTKSIEIQVSTHILIEVQGRVREEVEKIFILISEFLSFYQPPTSPIYVIL